MGTDFRKLKAPFVSYDLLHVLDVLSRFPWWSADLRLRDMIRVLWGKADDRGLAPPTQSTPSTLGDPAARRPAQDVLWIDLGAAR